jgi:hypothetical protein
MHVDVSSYNPTDTRTTPLGMSTREVIVNGRPDHDEIIKKHNAADRMSWMGIAHLEAGKPAGPAGMVSGRPIHSSDTSV